MRDLLCTPFSLAPGSILQVTPPIVSHTCGELVAENLAMAIAAAAPNATSAVMHHNI
jgi:hypothetical protein